jgi:hypothetical protein
MTMEELVFRAGRLMSTHVERLSAGRTSARPPDLSRLPNLTLSASAQTSIGSSRAQRIVNGYIDVLANYRIGEVPNWNMDPKTGLINHGCSARRSTTRRKARRQYQVSVELAGT